MSIKTLSMHGAVLTLLCLTTPVLQAHAVEATVTEPFLSTNSPAREHLTLRSALDRALQLSPELTAYREESRARAAEISQASVLINPELSIEVENVAGSGPYSGFDAAETTLQLSQQLEVGGKRQLRRGLAEVEHARSVHDLELSRVAVQGRVARHFLAMLAAQEHLALADAQIAVASRSLAVVEEKIAAGKAPAVEKFRFDAALAEARLMKEKAGVSLTITRQTLADHLGLAVAELEGVSGELESLPLLPPFSEVEAQLGQSPELVRQRLESDSRRHALDLARAERFVDPTIAVGVRNFNDSDENVLLFGLSLPLPLFNRNQGNVEAASQRLAAAQAQEGNSLIQSRTSLAGSWQTLAVSSAEAKMLREVLIPSAEQSYEAASYGYQSGKFAVLEMLAAQQSLIEVKERYLEVLSAAHLAAIELGQLLGRAPVVPSPETFSK